MEIRDSNQGNARVNSGKKMKIAVERINSVPVWFKVIKRESDGKANCAGRR